MDSVPYVAWRRLLPDALLTASFLLHAPCPHACCRRRHHQHALPLLHTRTHPASTPHPPHAPNHSRNLSERSLLAVAAERAAAASTQRQHSSPFPRRQRHSNPSSTFEDAASAPPADALIEQLQADRVQWRKALHNVLEGGRLSEEDLQLAVGQAAARVDELKEELQSWQV